MPPHLYGHICSKSSLALRGVVVLGGVIDPDFRGVLVVILQNTSRRLFRVNAHDVIAQIIFTFFASVDFNEAKNIGVLLLFI